MKVLIVGCGYVGTALGLELARAGHQVWGARRGGSGNEELEAAGILPVVADITRPETLKAVPSDCAWVVNCVSASGSGAAAYRRVYLEGNRHLLDWLAAHPPQKFVYTSSTGVYGQDDGSVVDETSATTPHGETARVLVETEQLLFEAADKAGFPAVILRVAGIYGPGRGYWLKQFLSGTAVLEGAGRRWLNMIHRDDVARAISAALERGQAGRVYNVVDDEPVTQLALFEWLSAKLHRAMPRAAQEPSEAPRSRGATNKVVSNRRLHLELGCALKYPSFRDGFGAEIQRLGVG